MQDENIIVNLKTFITIMHIKVVGGENAFIC